MLTKELINRFYVDVNSLGLKFPVAEIAKETGYSKGNVSVYLNGRSPSENFINTFYKKFSKRLESVPHAENATVGPQEAQNVQIVKDQDNHKPKDKLTTTTARPSFEMQPANGKLTDKDAFIKHQQEQIEKLQDHIKELTDLVAKLIEKR